MNVWPGIETSVKNKVLPNDRRKVTCELIPNENVLHQPVGVGPCVVVHEPEGGDHANVAGPEREVDHASGDLKYSFSTVRLN